MQAAVSEVEAARATTADLEAALRTVNGLKLTYASTSVLPDDQELGTALAVEAAPVSYTHLRAHGTVLVIVCRLLLEKKKHTRT